MYELAALVELKQPEREDITAGIVFYSADITDIHDQLGRLPPETEALLFERLANATS